MPANGVGLLDCIGQPGSQRLDLQVKLHRRLDDKARPGEGSATRIYLKVTEVPGELPAQHFPSRGKYKHVARLHIRKDDHPLLGIGPIHILRTGNTLGNDRNRIDRHFPSVRFFRERFDDIELFVALAELDMLLAGSLHQSRCQHLYAVDLDLGGRSISSHREMCVNAERNWRLLLRLSDCGRDGEEDCHRN